MRISIITVNFRQAEATIALLHSLRQQSFRDYELILVDNAPTEDRSADFHAAHPGLRLIVNADNRGFAGANNQGLAAAKGDFLFLLNNDTEVGEGFFETCLRCFDDPSVGAMSPMIKYFDQPDTIQYAGFTAVNALGRNRLIGQYERDAGQFRERRETPYAHGAAMLLSRSAYEKAGPMPEAYFLYYEELDWSVRIRRAGFRIVFEPAAQVLHKASLSTGRDSVLKTYYLNRNRIAFMLRHAPLWQRVVFTLYVGLVTAPAYWWKFTLQRRAAYRRAFVWALQDGFRQKLGVRALN